MQWKRMVLYYIASALKQGDKCGGSLDEDGHLVTKVQGGWMAVLKFGMGDAEYDKLKEEDRERLTRMTTNLRKQNKTFLAQYNEFCPSDPVKLANDRSAAPGASNEPSYFEVGVQYCLIGHEVHISGEAAQSTKGPKEQSEPWFAVADAFIVPDDDDEHPLQTADGYVKMQVSDVRKDRVVYNVEDPAGEPLPPPRFQLEKGKKCDWPGHLVVLRVGPKRGRKPGTTTKKLKKSTSKATGAEKETRRVEPSEIPSPEDPSKRRRKMPKIFDPSQQ